MSLTIRIIPLPIIKQIFVPTPSINKNIGIIYNAPKFKLSIPTPSFNTVFSKINLPSIAQFGKSSYFIQGIKLTKQKKRTKQFFHSLFSIFSQIK